VLEGDDGAGHLDELQDGGVELDEDGAVVWAGKHGGDEGAAGGDFERNVSALASASVDHESEGERKTGALGEVGEGLRFAVLLEEEVVAGEVGDGLAGLVACDGGDGDDAGCDFEGGGGRDGVGRGGGLGRRGGGSLREGRREQSEENERE